VPADERVGTNDGQQLPPGDESRQQHKGDAGRIGRASWPNLPLNVAGELLAQEQVLGGELGTRAEGRSQQVQQVRGERKYVSGHVARSYGLRFIAGP
jgi:hypothetical protein